MVSAVPLSDLSPPVLTVDEVELSPNLIKPEIPSVIKCTIIL